MKKIRYHWQPELALALIYWSFTLFVFFFSMILSLENAGPNLSSAIVFLFFMVVAYLNWRQYIVINTSFLLIQYVLPFRTKKLSYDTIQELREGEQGVVIYVIDRETPYCYHMRKKTRRRFISALKKKHMSFPIVYDKNLKFSRE